VGNNYNLAEACQIISWVHFDEGRFSEALDAIEEAWKHAYLTENAPVQAEIALDFGRILFSADRDTEAWEYLELSLMKASYVGNRLGVAQTLDCMGYGYLRRGNYQNAHGAYEAAAEKYLGTIDDWVAQRCNDNMAKIKQKQGNMDMVVGFHKFYFDLDPTLFYPPVQASASGLPLSGS
jgi:tetratricopeptide (TPR) repeat protein